MHEKLGQGAPSSVVGRYRLKTAPIASNGPRHNITNWGVNLGGIRIRICYAVAMTKPALERIARALCSHDGHPENIKFEGEPMWRSYLPAARAALMAIREPTERIPAATDGGWKAMVDAALEEGPAI